MAGESNQKSFARGCPVGPESHAPGKFFQLLRGLRVFVERPVRHNSEPGFGQSMEGERLGQGGMVCWIDQVLVAEGVQRVPRVRPANPRELSAVFELKRLDEE